MQNNRQQITIILAACVLIMTSCVSKKKYLESQVAIRYLKYDSTQLANKVSSLSTTVADLQKQVADQKKLVCK